ncbi:diguanylate cyclase [Magnetospirillum sulfuroxidans]|uniref:diguanylate cyclase n=1 Tax=Magnetospirillum sulfuroxidans TaxID=611300 RepID=A0ABS5IFM7_9PROT|nr:diguanylate cyclase [Magnetospirillum sulfuroxidans]MBR9973144.1 diguanylate cyclase [Magnetospirillum sulfuroxidans]
MPRLIPRPEEMPSSIFRYLVARATVVLVLMAVVAGASILALLQARHDNGVLAELHLPRFKSAVHLSMDANAAAALSVRMSTATSQAERRGLLDRLAERHQAMEDHIGHMIDSGTDPNSIVALRRLRDSLMDGAVALSAISQEEITLRGVAAKDADIVARLDELEQRRRNLLLRQQDLSSELAGFVTALAADAGRRFDEQRETAGRTALQAVAVVSACGLAAMAAVIWMYWGLRHQVVNRILALRTAMLNWRGGTVDVPREGNDEITQMSDTLVELIATVERRNAELEIMASTDPLTGLTNRRRFAERAEEEIRRAHRYDAPLSLIIGDIDHFKAVNDGWGHDIGDVALRHIAAVWGRELRDVDLAARMGGEEFIALLPETNPQQAQWVAERIRAATAETPLSAPGVSALSLTISLGVAGLLPGENLTDVMRRADQAMYRAKHAGRNVVCTAS